MSDATRCTCSKGDAPIKEHADDCAYRKAFDPDKFDGIVMTRERALCPVHGEVFRDEWPRGFPIFTLMAFQVVVAVDGLWEEARRRAGITDPSAKVDQKALEAVFDARPICCRLPAPELARLLAEARKGKRAWCKVCGQKRAGEAIQTSNMGRIPHICYQCVSTASATSQAMS